ncbi:MAG TPA: hypothetical protein VMU80_10795 [Bryobacteraceae bacterium]|nr:hypothetical protein [Bryobacteraceae bacterium]
MATGIVLPASAPPSSNGHLIRWAAAAGRWHFEGATASFQGPVSAEDPQPYGLALTDRDLTDGSVRVKIRFSPPDVAAGVVLGFQSLRSRYIIAQLGAYQRAYTIAEFVSGIGWQSLESVGSVENLDANRDYAVELRQIGQEIRMSVDGVRVIEQTLAQPLNGRQVGLFVFGKARVDFSDLTVDSARPRVFVAMQFGPQFDTLYKEVIYPCVERFGLSVVRMDEVPGPGVIFEDMKRQISQAQIVIAEITAPNQNVFYELGYAHALNKPTILVAQRGKELPFDIRSYRVIFYDDSIGGKPALERSLQKHLEAILSESHAA